MIRMSEDKQKRGDYMRESDQGHSSLDEIIFNQLVDSKKKVLLKMMLASA